jgi:hypothetical protein
LVSSSTVPHDDNNGKKTGEVSRPKLLFTPDSLVHLNLFCVCSRGRFVDAGGVVGIFAVKKWRKRRERKANMSISSENKHGKGVDDATSSVMMR